MTVYVSADALNSISREIQTARSIETGGILLGKDLKNLLRHLRVHLVRLFQ